MAAESNSYILPNFDQKNNVEFKSILGKDTSITHLPGMELITHPSEVALPKNK